MMLKALGSSILSDIIMIATLFMLLAPLVVHPNEKGECIGTEK